MNQTLEEYCRNVEEKAEKFEQEEEICRRVDHLRAFNFGRMAQRIEDSRFGVWLRVAWLLAGVTIGVAIGSVYPTYLYPALAHRFLTMGSHVVRGLGNAELASLWKILRVHT